MSVVSDVQLAYRATLVATNTVVTAGLIALQVATARNASLKHHSGVARRGFLWYKIALWLTALVYSLLVAISAVQLHRSIHGTRRSSQTVHLDRLIWVENWFDIASLAILLACIARLIVGTKMVVKQQGAKGYRIFIDVVTALVVILSFAGMIMRQIVWEKSFTGFNFEPNLLTSYSAIQTAVAGLLILGGLVNTVFAWVQAYAAKRQANGIYRGVGSFISAIATVFFVYILWTFVGTILFVVFTGPNDPTGWFFSDIFITRIAVLVIFYLIYKLGAKEENGLWLTSGHGTGVPKSSNEISLSQV